MTTLRGIRQIGGLTVFLGLGLALSTGVAGAAPSDVATTPDRSAGSAPASRPLHTRNTVRRPAANRAAAPLPSAPRRQPSPHRTAANTSSSGGDIPALLFNQSPGIRLVESTQGPNGVITGRLAVADPDSAALSITLTGKPTHGTVSISSDGSYTYTADPSMGVTGATDSFIVAVDDSPSGFHIHGLIGLINMLSFGLLGESGHVSTTRVPVNVAAFANPPAGLSTFCGCTLMPAASVFHADVSALPVLPRSGTWTALLGGNLRAAWGGDPWMGNTAGMPVNIASESDKPETVIFNRGLSTSGPTIDDRPYVIPDRPLVEGMPDAPAWDRHLLVLQQGSCRSQELYNVANGVELPPNSLADALANAVYASQYGSTWIAEAGVQYDTNSALYPVKGEANASQLPYLPLILRPDDLARGSIDHMLGIVIAKDRGTGYSWPARSGDGTGTNPDGVPMGTVFRLRSDFDVSDYAPATQVVLRALQEHGAVVYDSWNPGQDGAGLLAMSNGWSGTDYLTAQRQLSTIPLSAFDAIDVLSLAMDPTTGWMIRT